MIAFELFDHTPTEVLKTKWREIVDEFFDSSTIIGLVFGCA